MLVLTFLLVSLAGLGRALYDPNCDGKQVIVHLFEWKWTDVAYECERFLAGAGFCGVQVSPPNEHVVLPEQGYPWWQRYQPVSYKLQSRSGSEHQFRDMVKRCNQVGVRIYVDTVVNHMTGLMLAGVGSAGSFYRGDSFDYPGVPYSAQHFTPRAECPDRHGEVSNYDVPSNVRNCFLNGLTDLYGRSDYVRDVISGYFNQLIDIGVAGIRLDAAKHMWPGDIAAMLSRVKPLSTHHGFAPGSKLFVYQEVIDNSDGSIRASEYFETGLVTEFRFCRKLAEGIVDYQKLGGLIDYNWGMVPSDRAFVFVDNHDNQRGHGGAGEVITHKTPREYKQGVAYMLAQDYGFTRLMSSYYFDSTDQGPPHYDDFTTLDVPLNWDDTCAGGWVCEHRWKAVTKMVKFRNKAVGKPTLHYFNKDDVVAFSRGHVAFFAMAKYGHIDQHLQTGLPAGSYCNLIDDCQTTVHVGEDGQARVQLDNYEDPILAICVGCDDDAVPLAVGTECEGSEQGDEKLDGVQRTVVFIRKEAKPGQSLFLRGGTGKTTAIPIQVNSLGDSHHYSMYDAWRQGDTALNWDGSEDNQGYFLDEPPFGTPLAWTSNRQSSGEAYQKLNKWGDHYWMVDFDMDCSQTENGWFQVSAMVSNGVGWENDVSEPGCQQCRGIVKGQAPYVSKYHWARCGAVNTFEFGAKTCEIHSLTNTCGSPLIDLINQDDSFTCLEKSG